MIELIYIARRDALTSVEYLGSIWRPLGRTAADCAIHHCKHNQPRL